MAETWREGQWLAKCHLPPHLKHEHICVFRAYVGTGSIIALGFVPCDLAGVDIGLYTNKDLRADRLCSLSSLRNVH